MGDAPSSSPVYTGDVVIAEFDLDRLDELEAALEDIVDVSEGEQLYVSLPGGDRIEVQRLKEEGLE